MEKPYYFVMTYILATLVIALAQGFIKLQKNGINNQREDNVSIYIYPKKLQWIVYSGLIIFPILFIYGYLRNPEINDLSSFRNITGNILLFLFCYFGGDYFRKTKIILTESEIVKVNLIGVKHFRLSEIRKIIIYKSEGNSEAAMTKLFCGTKKMNLESFLIGYEELNWELESRCKFAKIVVK